jgi:PAS domain S-box-containing protein
MLRRKKFARRLSVGLSAVVMGASALTLVGWGTGLRRLTDWFDHDISQLPNNAVGVFAGGAATLLLALGYGRASACFALIAGLIGGATLLEHLTGVDLGIDTLLLTHDWGHSATVAPGRMGIPGSTSLLLTGTAIFLSLPERTRSWSAAGGLLVIGIAGVSIVGYVLGATLFYTVPHLTTVALQTAILLLALGLALVAALPDRRPTCLLIEDSAGALLVLRSLPGIVLVPVLIGWATLQGQRAGLFDHAFATAAMVMALTVLLSAALWRTAEAVRRHGLELSRSEERLSAMLGSITDAFMTVDAQWRYVFVNDHSDAHWGKSREAMLGSTLWQEFPEAVGSDAYLQLHRAMQERITVEYEYFHEPMQKWYGSRAYPTQGGGLAVYSRDISARKHTEQQLRQLAEDLGEANRRKNAFLATLAHELRNPLAPIVSGLELLKRTAHDPAAVERTRLVMERQALQLVRLIDDLLDLGRIDADKLELRREPVALADILEQALDACRPALRKAGFAPALSLPQAPVTLQADALRMVQVFVNLLTNACKFTAPGGHIGIEATLHGQDVVVAVSDTGIGIPADMLEEIFEMFSQVDQSLEREQQGLGIGLTLVKRMVQLHGGSVSAHSAGRGQGSTFEVRLPVATPSTRAHPATVVPAPAAGSAYRVLVVDDNRDAADAVALLLSFQDHVVETAYSGDEALRRAPAFAPDVILLDIGMPSMNGYEACHALRAQAGGDRIRIVALTGWGKDEDRQRSMLAGFDTHLVKPINEAALLAAIVPRQGITTAT